MKALHDFAKTLSDALALAAGTEELERRARDARLAEGRAKSDAENAKAEAARVTAEAREFSRRRVVEQDTIDANLKLARDAEKGQYEKWLADTKKHAETEGERLAAIKADIPREQTRLDEIKAEIAKQRASLAEAAAKF